MLKSSAIFRPRIGGLRRPSKELRTGDDRTFPKLPGGKWLNAI